METNSTMEWMVDALQSWMANHLVEVPERMILATQSLPITEPEITAKSQPEPGKPTLTDDPCIFKDVYGRYRSKPIPVKQHQ